jgi:hypothetical protein
MNIRSKREEGNLKKQGYNIPSSLDHFYQWALIGIDGRLTNHSKVRVLNSRTIQPHVNMSKRYGLEAWLVYSFKIRRQNLHLIE